MEKLVKRIPGKLIKSERGFALPLVMVLLLLGGLIISPLLGYMTTGLKAGKEHEELMERIYAADAGIEDAIHRIRYDYSLPPDIGDIVTYDLTENINNKIVTVTILKEDDALDFLEELLDRNFSGVHSEWIDVTDNASVSGTYVITVTDVSSNNKFLDSIGAWFEGPYSINGTSPFYCTINGTHPPYNIPSFEQRTFEGGTAFIWSWAGPDRPNFNIGDQMTLTFNYVPWEITGLHVAWGAAGSADIGIVGGMIEFGVYKVTATAIDNTTGETTQVVSYVAKMGGVFPAPTSVLTWEASP